MGKLKLATSLVGLTMALVSQVMPADAAPAKNGKRVASDPVVVMETNKGVIKLEVFKKDAPTTANNFLDLVGKGFYNGLTFHRVEPNFVIQGGDPQGTGTGNYIDPKTHETRHIPLEIKPDLLHETGALAMARSSDRNSASCQFYITLAPQPGLDGDYAVFGKVLEGQNVVNSIKKGDRMTKVTIEEGSNK